MNKFVDYLKSVTDNKKICILGFGREGSSTYKMLKKYCSCRSVTIADLKNIDREKNSISEDTLIISGEKYQNTLNDFDLVFKSPGIVLNKDIKELGCEITSETQIFFTCYREQIVAVTGTKGKSTVSSLIYHVLKNKYKDCYLVGNIGIPVFDIAENVTDKTIVVCELSCHQLEYMTVSPKTAMMLNIFEEHLDHYGTMEKYIAAKNNIYLHQQKGDYYYCNYDIRPNEHIAQVYTMSNKVKAADFFIKNKEIRVRSLPAFLIPTQRIKLLGEHNQYNIAAAYAVAIQYNVNNEEFYDSLCTFQPLSHRLEFVGIKKGIAYYDDSISTACATAIEALKSVPNPDTLLVGGMDRGIDYTELIDFLDSNSNINVICMEASGKRIYDIIMDIDFNKKERVHYAKHLEEAVVLASQITQKGKSCILSPAAASYGIFKNFEERGDVFKHLVESLR